MLLELQLQQLEGVASGRNGYEGAAEWVYELREEAALPPDVLGGSVPGCPPAPEAALLWAAR